VTPFPALHATLTAVEEVRVIAAALLFAVALYWGIGAIYEIMLARKPPGIFGLSLLRPMNPEPVLTISQWRKGGLFLLAMAVALAGLGVRLLQGWP
jgi:hypothetical protein